MKWQLLSGWVVVILNLNCADPPQPTNQDQREMEAGMRSKSKPASSYSDTIEINFPSAIFYNPDSLQLENIKAITDTMIFESTIHDCFYQMRNARISLQNDWPKIKIVEISKARWIRFLFLNGTDEYIDLNTLNDPCGILLFDGHKKPRLADMMNIDTDLGFYFAP